MLGNFFKKVFFKLERGRACVLPVALIHHVYYDRVYDLLSPCLKVHIVIYNGVACCLSRSFQRTGKIPLSNCFVFL